MLLGKRILVVEDNKDLRKMYSAALRQAGYEVHEVSNSQTAFIYLEQNHFDGVICNSRVSIIRATDFLRELFGTPVLENTKVILVSADPVCRKMGEYIGVKNFLERPADLMSLVNAVDNLLM